MEALSFSSRRAFNAHDDHGMREIGKPDMLIAMWSDAESEYSPPGNDSISKPPSR
jgi:hypothetical protein